MPYSQLPEYFRGLGDANETVGRLALMFLIATAARSTEVREACWRHIDLDRAEWRRPASLMRKSNEEVRQFPHRDQDMWRGADGRQEYLVNILWPLTPFTKENGATRIFPKSHGVSGMSKTDLGQPIFAECKPGSAICFLGSTAHGAGSNLSKDVRRGVLVSYSLGWLKPYENLWLAYPPEVARHFPPELAALAGYAQHRPNLGNYEGQCPSILLQDELPAHIGAIDALRPDQADAVAEFAGAERNGQ